VHLSVQLFTSLSESVTG